MVEAAERTGLFQLEPAGPYSLAASVRFLEGFAPARYEGDGTDGLRLAFLWFFRPHDQAEKHALYGEQYALALTEKASRSALTGARPEDVGRMVFVKGLV